MAITITDIGFHRDEHQRVVAAMEQLEERGDGQGWINFTPCLTEEEHARVPERSALGDFFAGRGPAVAMATWTPAARGAKPRPAQIGVEHGTGPKALDRLAEVGVKLPPESRSPWPPLAHGRRRSRRGRSVREHERVPLR